MTVTMAHQAPRAARIAAPVFTLTIFVSASLLFFVQPLFAKIVLPVADRDGAAAKALDAPASSGSLNGDRAATNGSFSTLRARGCTNF